MKILLLHSIKDASHCVKNNLHIDKIIYSTSVGVDAYLKENFNIDCICIIDFFTSKEILDIRHKSYILIDQLLKEFDKRIVEMMDSKFGVRIQWFLPMFSDYSLWIVMKYICFAKWIEKMEAKHTNIKFYIYNYSFKFMFDETDMSLFMQKVFSNRNYKIISRLRNYDNEGMHCSTVISGITFDDINDLLDENWLEEMKKINVFDETKKTILSGMLSPRTEFIKNVMSEYNFLNYSLLFKLNILYKLDEKHMTSILDSNKTEKWDDDCIINSIIEFHSQEVISAFCSLIVSGLQRIVLVQQLQKKSPIILAIRVYGVTPLDLLLCEYLKKNNTIVACIQNCFGQGEIFLENIDHKYFNSCNYYLSYGFSKEDLQKIYPEKEIPIEVIPVGLTDLPESDIMGFTAEKIDALVHLTGDYHLFEGEGGFCKVNAKELLQSQEKLIDYFEMSRKNFHVHIGPNPTYERNAILSTLKKKKNAKIVSNVNVLECVQRYKPAILVLDCPVGVYSEFPDLYAALLELPNTEIFVLNDNINPIHPHCADELLKRVHLFDNVDELLIALSQFSHGKLAAKRDNSYLNHYVFKENANKKLIDALKQIISNE